MGSLMRFSMGVQKNKHGIHYVRKKVPNGLQEAVAKVLANGKPRQTFLQKSLETKDAANQGRCGSKAEGSCRAQGNAGLG